MSRILNAFAAFLSTSNGFIATFMVLMIGIGVGALLQFNETVMFGFNILLSVEAIVISGIILVSAARARSI